MRRLYIVFAAALIASALFAVAISSGASAGAPRYGAVAFAPSVASGASADGYTLSQAKQNALRICHQFYSEVSNSYTGDCEGAVWVWNGYASVAYEKTLEGPPYNADYGWGWGHSKQTSRKYALRYCRQAAREPCELDDVVLNKGYPEGTAYRTQAFNPGWDSRGGGW